MDFEFQLTRDDWRDAVRIYARPYLPRMRRSLGFWGAMLAVGVFWAKAPLIVFATLWVLWSIYALVKTLLLPLLSLRKQFHGEFTTLAYVLSWD